MTNAPINEIVFFVSEHWSNRRRAARLIQEASVIAPARPRRLRRQGGQPMFWRFSFTATKSGGVGGERSSTKPRHVYNDESRYRRPWQFGLTISCVVLYSAWV